jgi:hypothetical protein
MDAFLQEKRVPVGARHQQPLERLEPRLLPEQGLQEFVLERL